MSQISVARRFVVVALAILAMAGSGAVQAGDGGGVSGSVSHFFLCKQAARDVDPAVLQLAMPGDAGQMDGCGVFVATGKKGVKVDVDFIIHDRDEDSDADSDSDLRVRRCRGRTGDGGQFSCTFSRQEFESLGLNEPLDFARIEALLKGGKKIDGFDLAATCSAGTSTPSGAESR